MTNQEQIQKLVAQIASEKDAEKKKELLAEAANLIAAVKASEQAEADALKAYQERAQTLPLYPRGLVVKFGSREATITQATKNAQGEWVYTIDLKAGEFLGLGDGAYTLTESEMREKVQQEVGVVAPWQAFAQGMNVSKNNVGGTIAQVHKKAGRWIYILVGAPREWEQNELLDALVKA